MTSLIRGIAMILPEAETLLESGHEKELNEDFDSAIEDYTEALDIDPSFAKAYRYRGRTKAKSGKMEEAFDDFERAIELEPMEAMHHVSRGYARMMDGDLGGAQADCEDAFQL